MAPRRPRTNPRQSTRDAAQPDNPQPPPQPQPAPQTQQTIAPPPIASEILPFQENPISAEHAAARRQTLRREFEERYKKLIKNYLRQQPEPQSGCPDPSQEVRGQMAALLDQLQMLLSERMRLAPAFLPQVESSLVTIRVKLDVLYWRTFRVNDLPPEILANIFRFVVWSPVKHTMGTKCRLWLTWVCRHWRSVAISDFTLWNAIYIQDLPPYERSFTWFERAGTAPLDLRIHERDEGWGNRDGDGKFSEEEMGSLLDKLLTKLSQIRMFIVVVDHWPPALVILDRFQQVGNTGARMCLERFELHRSGTPYVWIGPGYTPDVHRNPIKLFGGVAVPSLKYLCLNGVHIDWPGSSLSDLTTLDIRRIALEAMPTQSRFREILKNCPNLHKLALDGAGPTYFPDSIGLEPIVLPRLKILLFGDFSLHYALHVLAQIRAPHVRDLTLMNFVGEDYTPFVTAMTSCFNEVQLLTLYTFEVDDSPLNRSTFIKWLESMPKIRYLKIARIKLHMLETFLQVSHHNDDRSALTHQSNPNLTPRVPCPKLDILEYQCVDAEAIVAFGLRRKTLGVPLRKIYVNSPWVSAITREQEFDLRRVCDLFITPPGATTPEEVEIMRD